MGGRRLSLQRVVLGSRGSELARGQTAMVAEALRARGRSWRSTAKIITTRGDERAGRASSIRAPGRKGLFTGEIERALCRGRDRPRRP